MRLVLPLLATLTGVATSAWACDRAPSPFELDLGAALAVSDVVFIAKVKEVSEASATVEVLAPLRGAPAKRVVMLEGTGPTRLLELCAGTPLVRDKEVIVFAWKGANDAKVALIDPFAGLRPNDEPWRTKVKSTSPTPMSPWTNAGPVQTRLFRAPNAKGSNELDLLLLFRNSTAAPVTFGYSDWPEKTASTCSVSLVGAGASSPVAGKPVPISRADIEAYFSKHGRHFSVALPPGGTYVHRLARVTTAAPGWGYKEELAFTHWPIATPGPYAASVECRNFFGHDGVVRAGPVTVEL